MILFASELQVGELLKASKSGGCFQITTQKEDTRSSPNRVRIPLPTARSGFTLTRRHDVVGHRPKHDDVSTKV